jgi:hypothetical protein
LPPDQPADDPAGDRADRPVPGRGDRVIVDRHLERVPRQHFKHSLFDAPLPHGRSRSAAGSCREADRAFLRSPSNRHRSIDLFLLGLPDKLLPIALDLDWVIACPSCSLDSDNGRPTGRFQSPQSQSESPPGRHCGSITALSPGASVLHSVQWQQSS